MNNIPISCACFEMAFGRDVDYHDPYPLDTYLERDTGDILFVYENDIDAEMEGMPSNENELIRENIARNPDGYLYIPGRSHGDHHRILQEFLDSPWSDSESELQVVKSSFFGSIGGWMKTVQNQNAVSAYLTFKDKRIQELGEEFLRKNGIVPIWQ